jgi:hypothetical protein
MYQMSFGRLHEAGEFPFYELHEALEKFLGPFKCYVEKSGILDSCGYRSFVATMCIGMICAMRESRPNMFGMLEALIIEIKRPVVRKAIPKSPVGLVSWLLGFVRRTPEPSRLQMQQEVLARVPSFVDRAIRYRETGDYTALQNHTDALFNEGVRPSSVYHEYYINYLALVVATYTHFLTRERMIDVVSRLVEFEITSPITFYDDYDSDAVIVVAPTTQPM